MEVTFLGTGTSQGIPVIGCKCDICTSNDPRDTRLRTSVMLTTDLGNIIIDIGPDFRQQMLSNQVENLNAVLITHEHNDHIIGLDDIRPFYFKKGSGVTFYTTEAVESEIKARFPYAFKVQAYPGAPKVEIKRIVHGTSFQIDEINILPIPVKHGTLDVTGFRINDFVYITDASYISPESYSMMVGVKTMVINALQIKEHHSHFNLTQAIDAINIVKPKKAFLTHLSHRMGKAQEVKLLLPDSIKIAYDGLKIRV